MKPDKKIREIKVRYLFIGFVLGVFTILITAVIKVYVIQ